MKYMNLVQQYYRCDLELFNYNNSTSHDILERIPGKFAFFCFSSIPITEQVLKAAGKCCYYELSRYLPT